MPSVPSQCLFSSTLDEEVICQLYLNKTGNQKKKKKMTYV